MADRGELKAGADPIRGMTNKDRYSPPMGTGPADMGDMGFSKYPVGDQGQPASPSLEGDAALKTASMTAAFGSHEKFTSIGEGGQTGEEG